MLLQYDMKFVTHNAKKGQAITYFLADHRVLKNSKLYETIPDEAMAMNTTSENEK